MNNISTLYSKSYYLKKQLKAAKQNCLRKQSDEEWKSLLYAKKVMNNTEWNALS